MVRSTSGMRSTSLPKPMTKRDFATLVRRIKMHKDAVAKHRDAIRDLLDELEAFDESWSNATDRLEEAADILSQYL